MKSRRTRHAVAAVLMGGVATLAVAAPAVATAQECAVFEGDVYSMETGEHLSPCRGRLVKLDHPVKSRAAQREADRKQRAAQREADRKQRAAQREAARKQRAAQREAARKQRAAQREAAKNLSLAMDENGRYWS